MSMSAVESLAATHPDLEIWWDSSPLVYADWQDEILQSTPEDTKQDVVAQLQRLYDERRPERSLLRGSTTNPPLSLRVIESHRHVWDTWTDRQIASAEDVSPQELLWRVYGEVVSRGAAALEPIFKQSDRRYGYICGQVDPRRLSDLAAMVDQGQRLNAIRPNIMVKMPATKEGIKGIRRLAAMGIPTNATLCFSVSQLVATAEAARAGVTEARSRGVELSCWRSCASLMMGRFEDHPEFDRQAAESGVMLKEVHRRWSGIAIARRAYQVFQERSYETKLLCASMRLGPMVDARQRIWHLEKLTGGDMVLTIFPNIMAALLALYADEEFTRQIEDPVPGEVLDDLLRIPYFAEAYAVDGIPREDFIDLPGTQATGQSFAKAMQAIEDYCAERLEVQGIERQDSRPNH